MKNYLLSTFRYNDFANRKVLEKIKLLPDKTECIKFFSHLINSQNKWMARITDDKKALKLSWWDPLYLLDEIENEWNKSLNAWITYLESKTENELMEAANFTGFDGGKWEARLVDIALQLNYHSIHHRAQMQTIIRKQGLEPDFVDYISTVAKKIS